MQSEEKGYIAEVLQVTWLLAHGQSLQGTRPDWYMLEMRENRSQGGDMSGRSSVSHLGDCKPERSRVETRARTRKMPDLQRTAKEGREVNTMINILKRRLNRRMIANDLLQQLACKKKSDFLLLSEQ